MIVDVAANFAAFPLVGFTSGADRVIFVDALGDDVAAGASRAVAFADIFFGLRGGVVRAIGRAAFFLVVALTTLREADFLVGLATGRIQLLSHRLADDGHRRCRDITDPKDPHL